MAGNLLTCDMDNVVISALYPRDEGYVLRLWESAGRATTAAIALPVAMKHAEVQDFIGNPWVGDVKVDGCSLAVELKPWEIVTLYLEQA